jgi:hypothetical protein
MTIIPIFKFDALLTLGHRISSEGRQLNLTIDSLSAAAFVCLLTAFALDPFISDDL